MAARKFFKKESEEKNCCVSNSKIKEIRKEKNLSREELSALCGIHEQTLWRIESFPDYPTNTCSLVKIAKALDVPLKDLLKVSN